MEFWVRTTSCYSEKTNSDLSPFGKSKRATRALARQENQFDVVKLFG
jgi:hypothetical protein